MLRRTILALTVLAVLVGALIWYRASKRPAQDGRLPADQAFMKLMMLYEMELTKLYQIDQEATSDKDRRMVRESLIPHLNAEYVKQFRAYAEEYSGEERAMDALIWICTPADVGPETEQYQKEATDILLHQYIDRESLGDSLTNLPKHGAGPAGEKLLREVRQKSPHRSVQALALLCLAGMKRTQSDLAYLAKLPSHAALSQETEKLYQEIIDQYSDISKDSHPLGTEAEAQLYTFRHLGLGRQALDIEGEDLHGQRFKLSEYRGKVVVLTFWGFWCAPCVKMLPHEKALVERYEGKPFAVLGVNTDEDRKEVLKQIAEKGVTWRCWWNGGTEGPIARQWRVSTYPALYVLDHKGIIRYRKLDLKSPASLAAAVETLLKERMKDEG
jgi:thiol-disulfide isomerase/thioredoxin